MSELCEIEREALVLIELPERARIRELASQLDQLRDQIAAAELELETLREQLGQFELQYRLRLAPENALLARIASLVRNAEGWAQLLREADRANFSPRIHRLERKRRREAQRLLEEPTTPAPVEPEAPTEAEVDLKTLYRKLARRYHPDLTSDEAERVRCERLMSRLNSLYHARDADGMQLLAERARRSGELDVEEDQAQTLKRLEEKVGWFGAVLQNLTDELQTLSRCATSELFNRVAEGRRRGHDVLSEISFELRKQVKRSYDDVRAAAKLLEDEVTRFNRAASLAKSPSADEKTLARLFDPYAGQKLVRLGLEALARKAFSKAAQTQAEWVQQVSRENPNLLRVLLFTYLCERCQFSPPGLETYDGLAQRLQHLSRDDAPGLRATLEQTLVVAADLLELGVRRASPRAVQVGLRFRSELLREAIPLALQAPDIRRELRAVLCVLGKKVTCPSCTREVFELPLYRLRGLDELHASVCPDCGATLQSYWMPSGSDVQTVLNDVFLDLDLVSEWRFRLGRATVALQLLPKRLEELTVADLKQRFWADVLERHEMEIPVNDVQLLQARKRVREDILLADLDDCGFTVTFSKGVQISVSDAQEMIRHRIRVRFRPEAKNVTPATRA